MKFTFLITQSVFISVFKVCANFMCQMFEMQTCENIFVERYAILL